MGTAFCGDGEVSLGFCMGEAGAPPRRSTAAAFLGASPFSDVAPFHGESAHQEEKRTLPGPRLTSLPDRPVRHRTTSPQPGPECWSGFPFPDPGARADAAAETTAPERVLLPCSSARYRGG